VDVTSSRQTMRLIGRTAAAVAGLVLLALHSRPAAADQVYKCVDAQNHVTFSDRPCAPGAKKTDVAVQQADPTEAARLAKENQVLKSQDDLRKKQRATDDKTKAQQTQAKQAKCQTAKDHYYSLKDAGRIYQRDADGNKVYYEDSDADAKREEARQLMTIACGA
jgi:hypothetical protein